MRLILPSWWTWPGSTMVKLVNCRSTELRGQQWKQREKDAESSCFLSQVALHPGKIHFYAPSMLCWQVRSFFVLGLNQVATLSYFHLQPVQNVPWTLADLSLLTSIVSAPSTHKHFVGWPQLQGLVWTPTHQGANVCAGESLRGKVGRGGVGGKGRCPESLSVTSVRILSPATRSFTRTNSKGIILLWAFPSSPIPLNVFLNGCPRTFVLRVICGACKGCITGLCSTEGFWGRGECGNLHF